MSTMMIWLLCGTGVAALMVFLLPEKYRKATLRAPLSLLGGIIGWGMAALGVAIALVLAAHIVNFFLPP